jgi:hypothetical protein
MRSRLVWTVPILAHVPGNTAPFGRTDGPFRLFPARSKAKGQVQKERETMKLRTVLMLTATILIAGSALGQCRDPWVSEEVKNYKRSQAIGSGDIAECNYKLYGSNWNSRDQLKAQIAQTFNSLREAGLEFDSVNTMRDLKYHTRVYANAGNSYVGPRASAPYADQSQTKGGTYWWHIPLPNDHVLVVARKCRRGYSSAGPGANSGCVR